MNEGIVTTGLKPLVVGSMKTFQLNATLDGIFWDLTGGSASVTLKDPGGNETVIPATIINGVAQATWKVAKPTGTWFRSWLATDATGLPQYTNPIAFDVGVPA